MNLKLEVLLEHVLKLEELKNLKFEDALKIISHVPFLEWVNNDCINFFILIDSFGQIQQSDKGYSTNNKNFKMPNEHKVLADKDLLRLRYQNSEKTIILTGITKIWT
jgi:hypothetical protein